MPALVLLACACCALQPALVAPARAQEIHFGEPRAAGQPHVELLSDGVTVQAAQPQTVELRFRVLPGYHINSHHPKDEFLIPTVLRLDPGTVHLLGAEYPAGTPFHLDTGAGETLDVYQGEFRVSLRVVVPRGATTLTGSLRYQACDHAACYPPKTLPIKVAVQGQ